MPHHLCLEGHPPCPAVQHTQTQATGAQTGNRLSGPHQNGCWQPAFNSSSSSGADDSQDMYSVLQTCEVPCNEYRQAASNGKVDCLHVRKTVGEGDMVVCVNCKYKSYIKVSADSCQKQPTRQAIHHWQLCHGPPKTELKCHAYRTADAGLLSLQKRTHIQHVQ